MSFIRHTHLRIIAGFIVFMCRKNVKRYFISIQERKGESDCLWELRYAEMASIFLAMRYLGKWAPILFPPSFRVLREGDVYIWRGDNVLKKKGYGL